MFVVLVPLRKGFSGFIKEIKYFRVDIKVTNMSLLLENDNPVVYCKSEDRIVTKNEEDDQLNDEFDAREVFDIIKGIKDPEYPLTLEELNVVQEELISVNNQRCTVEVQFTPTVPHCSMATIIGLSIVVQLLRSLPPRFKTMVRITPGSHFSEQSVNKQLNDKERVAAALENSSLAEVINHCIAKSCMHDVFS